MESAKDRVEKNLWVFLIGIAFFFFTLGCSIIPSFNSLFGYQIVSVNNIETWKGANDLLQKDLEAEKQKQSQCSEKLAIESEAKKRLATELEEVNKEKTSLQKTLVARDSDITAIKRQLIEKDTALSTLLKSENEAAQVLTMKLDVEKDRSIKLQKRILELENLLKERAQKEEEILSQRENAFKQLKEVDSNDPATFYQLAFGLLARLSKIDTTLSGVQQDYEHLLPPLKEFMDTFKKDSITYSTTYDKIQLIKKSVTQAMATIQSSKKENE